MRRLNYVSLCLTVLSAGAAPPIDFARIPSPTIFRGDPKIAYRDPAAFYLNGTFHLFFSLMELESDGKAYWYTAKSTSSDLMHWTKPRRFTPRDGQLNFSSPGNVVRFGGKFVLCLQTYPTPNGEVFGNQDSRVWIMRSEDLEYWEQPEMLMVKGPAVPVEKMGRMIDPFLLEDKDEPGKWWCFYKQNGVSTSWSRDLKTWTYAGRADAGENTCVIVVGNEYVLFHSPKDGIGVKRSTDLRHWRDEGILTLGKKDWPWEQRRLTAGFVMDLRQEPRVGRYLISSIRHGRGTQDERRAWAGDAWPRVERRPGPLGLAGRPAVTLSY